MGLHSMGPPEALILALKPHAGWAEFIETGTFYGETTQWAADHFDRVTTIELSEAYHAAAKVRFRNRTSVRVLHGNSADVLREVIPLLSRSAIFWLDAHWSGLDTAGRESECPLLGELGVINASDVIHTVLVDDARLFQAPPPRPHRADHWPDLSTTVATLVNDGRRHVVLFDDVFVAVPIGMKKQLTGWLQDIAGAPRHKWWITRVWERIRS